MQQTKVTLATINGPEIVNATVIDGLAYHHRSLAPGLLSKDEWVVTHVASGRNPLPESLSFHSEQACQVFIEEIRNLADWSLSAEELWQRHGKTYHPSSTKMVEALRNAYVKALGSQP